MPSLPVLGLIPISTSVPSLLVEMPILVKNHNIMVCEVQETEAIGVRYCRGASSETL